MKQFCVDGASATVAGVEETKRKGRKNRRGRRRGGKKSAREAAEQALAGASSRIGARRGISDFVAKNVYVAIRCSWSNTTTSPCFGQPYAPAPHRRSISRVVLVNWDGETILDVSFRAANDNRKSSLSKRPPYPRRPPQRATLAEVKDYLSTYLSDKVLVGHHLDYELYALGIQHKWVNIRDCANYTPFMEERADPLTVMLLPRSLQDLSKQQLGRSLDGRDLAALHHSNGASSKNVDALVLEAKACLDLYKSCRLPWEEELHAVISKNERQRELNQRGLLSTADDVAGIDPGSLAESRKERPGEPTTNEQQRYADADADADEVLYELDEKDFSDLSLSSSKVDSESRGTATTTGTTAGGTSKVGLSVSSSRDAFCDDADAQSSSSCAAAGSVRTSSTISSTSASPWAQGLFLGAVCAVDKVAIEEKNVLREGDEEGIIEGIIEVQEQHHLPNDLLSEIGEDDDVEDLPPPRPDKSSHPVSGLDDDEWLDQDNGKERRSSGWGAASLRKSPSAWFRRRRGNNSSPPPRHREQPKAPPLARSDDDDSSPCLSSQVWESDWLSVALQADAQSIASDATHFA